MGKIYNFENDTIDTAILKALRKEFPEAHTIVKIEDDIYRAVSDTPFASYSLTVHAFSGRPTNRKEYKTKRPRATVIGNNGNRNIYVRIG